jgi:preprotein translocase subunit SecG
MIIGIFLIFVIILQEGKDSGLSGAIQGGSSESFLNTGGNRTKDARLKRMTSFFAVLFFVLVILTNIFALVTKTS